MLPPCRRFRKSGSAEFNEVFLDEVFVPDEDVLGAVNDGWRVARTWLSYEHGGVSAGDRTRGAAGGDGPSALQQAFPAELIADVLGWGSTYGPIGAAAHRVRSAGMAVAQAHLRYLNPFPANLGPVLRSYRRVVVPELNLGQLAMLLRAR